MGTHGNAIHLRTGDPGAAAIIDQWLERHGVVVIGCTDAFHACSHMVRNGTEAPLLAFVGTDWLAPDDRAIIRYLHERWPGVGIVLYGAVEAGVSWANGARLIVCRTRAALRDLVAKTPQQLLERSAPQAASNTALRSPPLPRNEPPAPPAVSTCVAAGDDAPRAPRRLDNVPPVSGAAEPTHLGLTREELAALLDETDA
ncbi:MAG: hypothetical protein KKB50_19225 [Planctomycetes bacterium]|nr:hypothetical protein [Planctomycetota bacterium]